MLNTKAIIDNATLSVQDNSAALRSRFLVWTNKIFRELARRRDWACIVKEGTGLAIGSNMVAKPTDFGRLVRIKGTAAPGDASAFYLGKDDVLSDAEAYALSESGDAVPAGWTLNSTSIVLHPGATGTADLLYVRNDVWGYADDANATAWADEFGDAVERKLLSLYYEYDMDERAGLSFNLASGEMAALRKWDNRQQAKPRNTRYLRTRK